MSFAYKKLNPGEIKSVPYVANKQYEYDSSSYEDNNIQTYIGEYIPITTDQPFDAVNDNLTTDGNYRRLIYESVRHLYYQNYITASSQDQDIADDALIYPDNVNNFWHSSSYDNYLQNTMNSGSFPNFRKFPYFQTVEYAFDATGSQYGDSIYFVENSAKIRVISVPKDKYGEGFKPGSFVISGSEFYMADDGQGNIYDYIKVIAKYGEVFYSAAPGYYSGEDLAIPVGNIFYNHGIAVITNVDYLCFIGGNPVARNDYISILNTQENKILDILNGDFDDCVSLDPESVSTSPIEGFTFPDYSVSASGDLTITPNLNSIIPGGYKLQYTVDNTLGNTSNTASISLEITSQPLTSSIESLTQTCWEGNESASLTFSIDKGIPPYSWSIDGINYNPTDDLFQPILSASLTPTRSLVLSIKDNVGKIVTQSINTAFIPIDGKVWQNDVSNCGTNDGSIIVSASGASGIISASLTASFSSSLETPCELTGLEVGTYTVYLQDSNLCTSSSITSVTKTIPVTASYTITHIGCFGTASGKIILNELDTDDTASDSFLTGGTEPLTWSWAGPDGFSTSSQNIIDASSGSYILNIFDADGCNYSFNYEVTSSPQILYSASVNYSSSDSSQVLLSQVTGGIPPYNIFVETNLSEYSSSFNTDQFSIILSSDSISSGSASVKLVDSLGCESSLQELEIYGRVWEASSSFCEDGTGSVAQRTLNFYTYESTGSEWVTVKISSGSETPIEFATSGSATGSYTWNTNDTLHIDVHTGSNDNFYLRREYSGSLDPGIKDYYITVADPDATGNVFYLNGSLTSSLELKRNVTYSFTQSDSTNTGHPFRFSTTQNGTHGGGTEYTTGVSASGTPGTNGLLEFAIPPDAPDTLYYYCMSHSLMGGSSSISMSNAVPLVLRNDITASTIIEGNANLIHSEENLDVSLAFGPNYAIDSLHLTASKVNSEEENTSINFKFDRQILLSKIRDNFTGSATSLITTGSDGSGSNFIARDNEFIDTKYGDTGSFIGPNTLLFRDSYAFGNIINTISGSSVEYTSGSIFSGSVSASIFGGENGYYFTQRTDKIWLMTADIDNIGYLEVFSYTDADQYENDPVGTRQNTEYTYRDYKIFAGSQRMEHDLMYIMIIHEDEYAEMPLPAGLGGGEIFNRRLQNLKDVNRVYYLFMSPIGYNNSQAELDSRATAVGQYFIDNVIYG